MLLKLKTVWLIFFISGSIFLGVTLLTLLRSPLDGTAITSSENGNSLSTKINTLVVKEDQQTTNKFQILSKPKKESSNSLPTLIEDLKKQDQIIPKENDKPKQTEPSNTAETTETAETKGVVNICPLSLEEKLNKPSLSKEEYNWCLDQLNPSIGAVVVGKSWGNLKTHQQRTKFEDFHCNSVNSGMNPSCSDAWGDAHINNWRKNLVLNKTCSFANNPTIPNLFKQSKISSTTSNIQCYKNEIEDTYCSFTNFQINFNRFQRKNDQNGKSTRVFEKDFLSIPCNDDAEGTTLKIPGFKLDQLFSTTLSNPKRCDVFIPGTTVLFGHDNIRNLAHTMNDIMNVWLIMWLEGTADQMKDINFLTVDGLKAYHNFDDIVNEFYLYYKKHFKQILRAIEFQQRKQIVCFEKIITQALPARGFVWDHWQQDLPCSFIGPSSLYQRWNLQTREGLGLLPFSLGQGEGKSGSKVPIKSTFEKLTILLIVRSEKENEWGDYRTSRLYINLKEIIHTLNTISQSSSSYSNLPIEIKIQDFKDLPSYEDQIRLLSTVNLLIGMHGAGITHSMSMSLGSDNCCGVIEIIPTGEFSPVRGFANMIRKMNFHYTRIAINRENSRSHGAVVPINELKESIIDMLKKIQTKPACILPTVMKDPYFKR